MSAYKHILIGLDLSQSESLTIAKKAISVASVHNAKISLTHIVEPLAFAYAADIPVDVNEIQKSIMDHAQESLSKLVQKLQVEPMHCSVEIGQTATELRRIAGEIKADLIVVGSHGRHGLALIFGSTTSSVLHGVECDVLAVRV